MPMHAPDRFNLYVQATLLILHLTNVSDIFIHFSILIFKCEFFKPIFDSVQIRAAVGRCCLRITAIQIHALCYSFLINTDSLLNSYFFTLLDSCFYTFLVLHDSDVPDIFIHLRHTFLIVLGHCQIIVFFQDLDLFRSSKIFGKEDLQHLNTLFVLLPILPFIRRTLFLANIRLATNI